MNRLLLAVALGAFVTMLGCELTPDPRLQSTGPGDAERGKLAIGQYGCASCHTIPGIRGADGLVGPSLEHVASRMYIGGVLTNTHGNMIRWIENPRAVDEKTAMPNLGITREEAIDIASYLYTLR